MLYLEQQISDSLEEFWAEFVVEFVAVVVVEFVVKSHWKQSTLLLR